MNTPVYSRYYIDYAAELPKIKHKILESEVNWYIEDISLRGFKIGKTMQQHAIFQPILKQDPLLTRHTLMVIYFALEQLEIIASKMTIDNAIFYVGDQERYTWCLTAMVLLLPEEDQDPFKENGIHQRWKNAREKMSELCFDQLYYTFRLVHNNQNKIFFYFQL